MSVAAPASSIPVLLLAAGASTRMRGRDKLLEPVGGVPLLCRQAQLARRVTRGAVIVTVPPAPHARHALLADLDVTRCAVADAAQGMSASLRAGMDALPPDTTCALLLLADLPALTQADLEKVLRAVDLQTNTLVWRGTTAAGKPGHPIVLRADLFAEFAALSGDTGGRAILAAHAARTTYIALPNDHALLDLDTPEDWAAWRAR